MGTCHAWGIGAAAKCSLREVRFDGCHLFHSRMLASDAAVASVLLFAVVQERCCLDVRVGTCFVIWCVCVCGALQKDAAGSGLLI